MKKVLQYTKSIIFLVKTHENSSKVLFKLEFFPMILFIIELGTQIYNTNMKSSKLIIEVLLKR